MLPFKTYLVGGAVRDQLLGTPIKERDYVVVGATPEAMAAAGFKPVGKDFPVFLHPETKEEYALARTERKTRAGYHGFEFHASKEVTLEEDLRRRDLTINAMALDPEGGLIDPYAGKTDLNQRCLRHVSEAFVEDPVRVLRLARFAARYKKHGFSIAPETLALAQKMQASGELDALVPERVWQETRKALEGPSPEIYFEVLRDCGALKVLFPALEGLFEKKAGDLAMQSLARAAVLSPRLEVRFAALLHLLDESQLKQLMQRYKIGQPIKGVAEIVSKHYQEFPTVKTSEELLAFFHACDALRRPERFVTILQACEACFSERKQLSRAEFLLNILKALQEKLKKEAIAPGSKELSLPAFFYQKKREYLEEIIEDLDVPPVIS